MTGLILFIRRLVVLLREEASGLEAPGAAPGGVAEVVRGIANAVEKAAKETLLA